MPIDTSQMTPQELETHLLKEFFCRNLKEVGIYAEPTESLTQLINKLRWLRMPPEYGPEFRESLVLPGSTAELLLRRRTESQALVTQILADTTASGDKLATVLAPFVYGKSLSVNAATQVPVTTRFDYDIVSVNSLAATSNFSIGQTPNAANPQAFSFATAYQTVRTAVGYDAPTESIKLLAMEMRAFGSSSGTTGTVYYNHGILWSGSPITTYFRDLPIWPTRDSSNKGWLTSNAFAVTTTLSACPYLFDQIAGGFRLIIPTTMVNYTGFLVYRVAPTFSDFWFAVRKC